MIKFEITKNEANQRVDKFLKKYLKNAALSHIYKLIRKDVKINGKRVSPQDILQEGDEFALYISAEEEAAFRKESNVSKARRQFGIAYEDENLLIVVKPFGILTHGDAFEKKHTLANQVTGYLTEKGAYHPEREKTFSPAPANRLDRNTTGLVIFGKNSAALQGVNAMLKERGYIRKFYQTIAVGELKKELVLRSRLIKDEEENKVSILREEEGGGKEAVTIVRPLRSAEGYTLLEVELITGRTHQIRAHLAEAGFPIMGDPKYGDARKNQKIAKDFDLKTQILHASKLVFDKAKKPLEAMEGKAISAELPAEFNRIKETIFD